MTLAELFNSCFSTEEIRTIAKDLGYKPKYYKSLEEITDEFAVDILKSIEDTLSSTLFISKETIDEDRDHGVWTERFILFAHNMYYAADIEFFGQGDSDTVKITLKVVKPKKIEVIIYEEVK
jgi:hypothetical protein